MRFLDLFKKETPFPEKGLYKGAKYRIDGDAVMMLCSSGRELELRPAAHESPESFDEQRRSAIKGKARYVKLVPWIDSSLDENINRPDNVTSGNENGVSMRVSMDLAEQNANAYGISLGEYVHLISLGREIFAKRTKSQARMTNNS